MRKEEKRRNFGKHFGTFFSSHIFIYNLRLAENISAKYLPKCIPAGQFSLWVQKLSQLTSMLTLQPYNPFSELVALNSLCTRT